MISQQLKKKKRDGQAKLGEEGKHFLFNLINKDCHLFWLTLSWPEAYLNFDIYFTKFSCQLEFAVSWCVPDLICFPFSKTGH